MYENLEDPKLHYSELLFDFITRGRFNLENLDAVNVNGVTPLTFAVANTQEEITLELLSKNVNPLIENIHGNTPLKLGLLHPWFNNTLKLAINWHTCEFLNCSVGEKIIFSNNSYMITKIIQGGACSLVVMEIQDLKNGKIYFAKIKPYFGGFEVRNYILLEQYIDLFQIDKLIIPDLYSGGKVYKKVCCLVEKYIPGRVLSETLNNASTHLEKELIVKSAIQALCNLHQQGYVHNDALPDNCLWDPSNKVANFIDYDVMRRITDFGAQEYSFFKHKKLLDLEKLIIGQTSLIPEKNILGLKYYVSNMSKILSEITDLEISSFNKQHLLALLEPEKYKINQGGNLEAKLRLAIL